MSDRTEQDLATAVDHLAENVGVMGSNVERLRTELVRRDVYDADQRLVQKQMQDLEKDVEELKQERKADRLVLLTVLLAPLLVGMIILYVSVQVGG